MEMTNGDVSKLQGCPLTWSEVFQQNPAFLRVMVFGVELHEHLILLTLR